MNLLELVPSLERQLRQYREGSDTDSELAGYLADGVEALAFRWDRTYTVAVTAPKTYVVSPDIELKDRRPVVVMAAIIYILGNWSQAYLRDGDFAYDPRLVNAQNSPLSILITELGKLVPEQKLASARTAPMRGFNNIYNREGYDWSSALGLL